MDKIGVETYDICEQKYKYFIRKRDQQYDINNENDESMFNEFCETYEMDITDIDDCVENCEKYHKKNRKNTFSSNKILTKFISNKFVRFKFKQKVFK